MTGILASVTDSGPAAIITAVGGASVSIFTVYRNAKRQDKATQDNTDLINNLNGKIISLTDQIIELRTSNAALLTELTILKEQFAATKTKKKK